MAGGRGLEALDLDDSLVGHGHLASAAGTPVPSYHAALAASPERMLLLTTQGRDLRQQECQGSDLQLLPPAVPLVAVLLMDLLQGHAC